MTDQITTTSAPDVNDNSPRPVPACALRAKIPTAYLRSIVDWAQSIAEFQERTGNLPVASHAMWMCAVLNPDWEDGECSGMTAVEASRNMWAACGSQEAHAAHRQAAAEDPQEARIRAVMEVMGWEDDRDRVPGGEVPPGAIWNLAADVVRAAQGASDRPRVVVLCGSTRFRDEMGDVNRTETLAGRIVVAPGVFAHSGDSITDEQKAALDALHLRKIDLADQVIVVNPGGYIGDSTRAEIAYAERTGKPVRYLEPVVGEAA
jgi:hypothetical protein